MPTLRKTGSYKISRSRESNTIINKLRSILKDAECILTFQDLINISHKQNIKQVCNYLAVKSLSERGNISNTLNEIENMQELLKIC